MELKGVHILILLIYNDKKILSINCRLVEFLVSKSVKRVKRK